MDTLEEIKPYIVTFLHNDRVRRWKEIFREQNTREPNQKEINYFVVQMIALGNIDKEATEKGILSRIKASTIPICILLCLLLLILFTKEIPPYLQSGAAYYGTIISIVVFILILISLEASNWTKKDK